MSDEFAFLDGCSRTARAALIWALNRIPGADPVHEMPVVLQCDADGDARLERESADHGHELDACVGADLERNAYRVIVRTDLAPAVLAGALIHELAHLSLGHVSLEDAACVWQAAAKGRQRPRASAREALAVYYNAGGARAHHDAVATRAADWGFRFLAGGAVVGYFEI
jgi:hypothetical protein